MFVQAGEEGQSTTSASTRNGVDCRVDSCGLGPSHHTVRIHTLVCGILLLGPDVDLIDHSGQAVEHNHQIVKAVPTNNQIQADSDEPLVQDRTAVISRPKQVSPHGATMRYMFPP
jgi:hypothetical protein